MAPVSPVKRVTRARAATKTNPTTTRKSKSVTKASEEGSEAPPKNPVTTKATTTRQTKPAAAEDVEIEKPTKRTKKAKELEPVGPLSTAPRRRVKVTLLDAPEPTPEAAEPKKAPTKSKKAEPKKQKSEATADDDTKKPTKKTRATRSKAATVDQGNEQVEAAPKPTRGRPKKAPVPKMIDTIEVGVPARQTRARTVSNASSTIAAAEPVKKAPANRKKVTFQHLPEDDKENVPIASKRAAGKKAAAAPASGLRAKPIRKPASATVGVRKKTAAPSKKAKAGSRILTPKKITQVARSSTPNDPSEDELNGGKTPIRELSLSPKRAPNALHSPSPVERLDFSPALAPGSPTKQDQAHPILSPARRPPPSPYKDALKESPRRGDAAPVFPASAARLTANAVFSTSEPRLLESPRRGVLEGSAMFGNSILKPKSSPFKASLMQSPARRLFSPQKSSNRMSPAKADNITSPDAAVSCNFRASQSPERTMRVYNLSQDELATESNSLDFDESVLNIRSPVKAQRSIVRVEVPVLEEPEELSVIANDLQESTDAPVSTENAVLVEENTATSEFEHMEDAATTVSGSEIEHQISAPNPVSSPSKFRDVDESSEDELQSPDKTFMLGSTLASKLNFQPRTSAGLSGLPRGMGFTPLANKLDGWRASSPDKLVNEANRPSMFSPVAEQHVPGSVQITRQSTPRQKTPASRVSTASKLLTSSRLSVSGTPSKTSFFEDEMKIREMNEALETHVEVDLQNEEAPFEQEAHMPADAPAVAQPHDVQDEETTEIIATADELTTDLVNQTMFTDTAVLDFAALAQEATELAPEAEADRHESFDSSTYGDENAAPVVEVDDVRIADGVINTSEETSASASQKAPSDSTVSTLSVNDISTPPMRRDMSQPRFVNTVVSKVPLRPEGDASPLKVSKKRSRSMSNSADPLSASKRQSLEGMRGQPRSQTLSIFSPPKKRGEQSPAVTTPGQTSFVVDDFGDSTLDGIELPNDIDDEDSFADELDESVVQSAAVTPTAAPKPASNVDTTTSPMLPVSHAKSSARTPRSVSAPSPAGLVSSNRTRTPLKPVASGILSGATVFVDVHTSEGADASGIFVELLTSMGARCVREWKWNGRASLAAVNTESSLQEALTPGRMAGDKPGITHVVYKDGGVRTLEKVREANRLAEIKGEAGEKVLCVGVGWVLEYVSCFSLSPIPCSILRLPPSHIPRDLACTDHLTSCERTCSRLPESPYQINTSIMPRGGSRRRKSMEPRMLALDSDGGINKMMVGPASKRDAHDRRSVSAEHFTPQMKADLINTPVRNSYDNVQIPLYQHETYHDDEADGGDDDDQDQDQDDTVEIHPQSHTPTGYVRFDPAVDPMTPAPAISTTTAVNGAAGRGGRGMQSCPPKQTQQGLFDTGLDREGPGQPGGEMMDEGMRRRLAAVRMEESKKNRRTTTAGGGFDWGGAGIGNGSGNSSRYSPKIRSPLARYE